MPACCRTTAGDGLAGCRDAGGTAQSRPAGRGQGALLLRRRRAGAGATRRMAERSALARLRASAAVQFLLAAPSERGRTGLPATGAASCRALRRAARRRTDRPGPGGGSAGIVRASRGTRAEQAGKLSGRLLFRLPEGSAALVLVTFWAYWQKGNSEKPSALRSRKPESRLSPAVPGRRVWLCRWKAEGSGARAAAGGLADLLREQCRKLSVDPESFDENQDVSHREREILRWWRACRTAISRRRCTCRKPPSSGTCTTCSPSWCEEQNASRTKG